MEPVAPPFLATDVILGLVLTAALIIGAVLGVIVMARSRKGSIRDAMQTFAGFLIGAVIIAFAVGGGVILFGQRVVETFVPQ